MKTCPICKAKAFDDAAVCYGCMHRFGEKPEQVLPIAPQHAPKGRAIARLDDWPPSFQITLTPPALSGVDRAWTCSVEVVST